MITELLYHRLFFYTNVCEVLLHRIDLLNQIELPKKFDYEEVRLEEDPAPPRRPQLHSGKDGALSSPRPPSLPSPHSKADSVASLSDSSAGEFELVDDADPQAQLAKIDQEDKKVTKASVSR